METINHKFKVVQLNAENLFLFMDFYKGENLKNLNEVAWQKMSSSSEANKSLMKTKWLAEAIQDMNPDLLLLNEVGGWESATNFNRYFLGNQYEVLMAEGNSDRGIDVGYLLKRDLRFSTLLLTHKDKVLSFNYPLDPDGKQLYFSRDALELRLFKTGQLTPWLCVFNLHLKSKLDRDGIDPKGRERRRSEVKAFLDVYRESEKALGPNCYYLVGGDFNGTHSPQLASESEFSAFYDNLNLKEVFEYCRVPIDRRATQIQFHSGSKINHLQLDGFWASENLLPKLIPEETGVYLYKSDLGIGMPYVASLNQKFAMPSDHYPTRTSIQLD